MSELKVAARYAKSLIDLSKEQHNLETVMNNMKDFLLTLKKNPQIEIIMKSPVVATDDKIAVLRKIFAKSYEKNMMSFFEIIVNKNRSYFLKMIAEVFVDQYNELNNIMKASVKTASAIDEKTYNEVKKFMEKYTGKTIELDATVDPKLIGGLVIQMNDKLFDASISGQLYKVKQELLNTYISK